MWCKVPGAELGITSDGFFDLETQPKKCAVFGGTAISIHTTARSEAAHDFSVMQVLDISLSRWLGF